MGNSSRGNAGQKRKEELLHQNALALQLNKKNMKNL
jgi:hypothetical protein